MKRIVVTALILLLVGILGTAVTAGVTDTFSFDTVGLHEEYESKEDINKVMVDASSPEINLIPTDQDKIKVILDGKVSEKVLDQYEFEVKESGDTLTISLDLDLYFNIGVAIADLTLDVHLPEKSYHSIDVNSSSGDITLKGMNADHLVLESSSGDINLQDSSAASSISLEASSGSIEVIDSTSPQFEANASSGDISFKDVEGDIMVNTSSGEINLDSQEISGDFIAEASSGDVTVNYKEIPSSLAIDFRSSSGEGIINLEGVLYEEKAEDLIIGKIGSGEHIVKIRVSSGDFQLN
ncbi:DUF4097 family beta strand repeat-containing protein [Bacillus sp. AK128]